MRFFTTSAFAMAIATVAALPQTAISGGANPITAPVGDVALEAGKPFTIKWAHDFGKQVTLNLRRGSDSSNLDDILIIVPQTANDGEYTWTPPTGLKGGKDYAIEIIADGSANYSPRFQIDSKGPGIGAETAVPTSTKAASTSAAASSKAASASHSADASATPTPSASESAQASGSDASAVPTATGAPVAAAAPASGAGTVGASLTMVMGAVAGALYFL
ncbi:Ser-Thr-rich glycosyl-phosphatidyl-inositol-anchored membrane family-domain-containing protein [Pyronema domesticum]|nr:Ser-Thr-rich glycosyl-phosphatidyl-inositol-anchored membrane family-domain-containing protein [Pyronema domesticum]